METRFCYHVENFTEMRHFYESILGWTVYSEWDRSATDKGVVYHAGATALLEFLLCAPGKATDFNDRMYLYIEVADLDDLHARLQKAGQAVSALADFAWGHSSFTVHDPAGLMLKFFRKN